VVSLQAQLQRMAAVSELAARVGTADVAKAASQILSDQTRRHLSVDTVLVGLCHGPSIECKLTAVSDAEFAPDGPFSISAQAVLQECIARGEPILYPPTDSNSCGGMLAHQHFARLTQLPAIISSPLRDTTGRLCGAWAVAGPADAVHTREVRSFLRAAESPVAAVLHLVMRSEKGSIQQAFAAGCRLARERRGQTIMALVGLLVLVLCLPLSYQVKCDCTVEPVQRRFVAAPFAGPLEKSFVEPGDTVEEGQLLALMDGRELRMELAGIRADVHRATKERDGYLVTLDSGKAEMARHEVDSLQSRRELLEHRERNAEIHSPIAGVVVSGDHKDTEGMPLEVGQTLFEIAPLDTMVVEIGIPEEDFAYVRPGMSASIRLDAFPLRRLQATVVRIHPRAELRDDANVFIAEVKLEDTSIAFRPGMHGTARVKANRYPLGWNLFRRPLTTCIAWLGW
ncbi:MAG: HlyD family efflux transporter periplasmic adaptor subunit, partial [Planctomycetales bacterium]|nr:HlyD family efflux transporter periplasmic adaptor subunit [Planctomycetales bacterium]